MSGVTRSIRNQLNFHDEKKWKQFSTRRLELIDRFSLSSKKASEQDEAISQIAALLRDEFGFPEHTLPEFDRLVRAAIQSVRRNRKRSSKARPPGTLKFLHHDDSSSSMSSSLQNPQSQSLFQHQHQHHSRPAQQLQQQQQLHSSLPHLKPHIDYGMGYLPNTTTTSTASSASPSLGNSPSQTHLPSIRMLTEGTSSSSAAGTTNITQQHVQTNNIGSAAGAANAHRIPIKLPLPYPPTDITMSSQTLLNYIHKSKSCLSLSNNDTTLHEDNLFHLGMSIITASSCFILERYFNDLPTESVNYLSEKLQSTANLAKTVKALGFFSSDVMVLSDVQATSLLAKLIGCCVKDFGFDPITYTLSEIFHEVVLNEYPLTATQVNKITAESLYTPLMPIKPKEADVEVSKEVKLQYGHRVLDFKYAPLSSAPPTYLELLENGRVAFGIQDLKSLRLRYEGQDISEDALDKLFKDLERRKIVLELYEPQTIKFTPLL